MKVETEMPDKAIQAAELLMREHAEGVRFHPFASEFGIDCPSAAYLVQREYVRLQREGRRVSASGYKVGLPSARMQAMCNIDSPIAGVVLQDRVKASDAVLARSDHGRLGVEFEIAVQLGRDIGGAATVSEVAAAVEAVCA